ncbi:MAG: ABC transporter substrate-binding protein [Candidatus Enteromonas sp.]|nr:ABC transporter substrate-binding protein [Candidatus Enteromonas sp.]
MNKKFLVPTLALGALMLAACGGGNSTGESSVTSGGGNSGSAPISSLPVASGAHQFIDRSYEERVEILGKLEKYAVDHAIAGLPLYEDSGYVMYQDRIVKGTNNYVTNYGFSIMRDGYIKEGVKLTGDTSDKYGMYYHTWTSSDPGTLNAWNDDGSAVPNLLANATSAYFGQQLNSTKDGYEFHGVLSTDDHMLAVENGVVDSNPTATELHQTWRMHVRTGEKGGVAYRTNSKLADRAVYDGKYVTLEDYITPYKMLLNGSNALYRGTEMAKKTGKGAIVGVSNYYSTTKGLGVKGVNTSEAAEAAWENVGIKSGTDADGDYLEFTFQIPVNRFYAMYSINSDLHEPIPASFIDLVGIDNFAGYSNDLTTSPIDNLLCLGPYYLESWETEKLVTFKRNDNWYERVENPNLYRIEGIHEAILTGYAQDKTVGFKEYLAGKLDSVGIPSNYLADYSSHPQSTRVPGEAVWKLNINSCTQELWEELFGVKGSIAQTAEADYWDVKPWMSNENFLRGLFYSINRQEYASYKGGTPSINYFSGAYMSNPETGQSYNSTPEHEAALEDFWGDTIDTYGYNLALSESAFEAAITELIAEQAISETDTEISIDVWWMFEYQIEEEGAKIKGYVETAFNKAAANLGLNLKLTVNNYAGTVWTDVYYKHLMLGQFDLGFGSISGNALDPLNFMEVLKSSNSSGFTLNWGADTTAVAEDESALVFEGERWSFDGLWDAADGGVVLDEDGQAISAVKVVCSSLVQNADGSVTVTGKIDVLNDAALEIEILDIFGTTDPTESSDYWEVYPDESFMYGDEYCTDISWDDDGNFTFTLLAPFSTGIINAGGIPVFGVDFNQYIEGVYGGMKSAYAAAVLPE